MTDLEKVKAYDEAIERAKGDYIAYKKVGDIAGMDALTSVFPQIAENEDERIRKWLYDYFSAICEKKENWLHREFTCEQILAYLEKQKELPFIKDVMLGYPGLYFYDGERLHFQGNPAMEEKQKEDKEELVYRLNGLMQDYIKESKDDEEKTHRFKCYCLFWDALEDADFFEPKLKFYPGAVIKCTSSGSLWVRCKDGDNIRSDGHTACIGGGFELASEEEAVQFFQELNENGYQWDCIKGRPMKKEQQPAEKQDYTGFTDLERSIHRGFLSAGIENVPVTIIKETAQECLTHIDKPAEWSEEDDALMDELESYILYDKEFDDAQKSWRIKRLKSLRPSQKLNEEEIKKIRSEEYTKGFNDAAFGGKLKEWSEEDRTKLAHISRCIRKNAVDEIQAEDLIYYITDIIHRAGYHWKPSEEQMKALSWAINYLTDIEQGCASTLALLKFDLKELI